MAQDQAVGDVLPLSGRGLRFVLVDQLRQRHTMTVTQMVAALTGQGYVLAGRPSKVISDALRWETTRGRVVRVARGVYKYGRTPPSTARRIKAFAAACREWIVYEAGSGPATDTAEQADRAVVAAGRPAQTAMANHVLALDHLTTT